MKLKHRALALILTLMMVLAYMPAMAFAEGEDIDSKDGATAVEEASEVPAEKLQAEKESTDNIKLVKPDNEIITSAQTNAGFISTDEPLYAYYSGNPVLNYTFDTYSSGDAYSTFVDRYIEFRPKAGDKITLEYEDESLEYTYKIYDDGSSAFEYSYVEDGSELTDYVYVDYDYDEDDDLVFTLKHYGEDETDWAKEIDVPYVYKDDVSGISFSPASLTVEASNIACNYETGYDFEYRGYSLIDDYNAFYPGDILTVRLSNGTSKAFTFKKITVKDYDEVYDEVNEKTGYYFVSNDNVVLDYYYRPGVNNWAVKLGANTVYVYWDDYSTPISVFVDSPEQRAARAEEARQGTYIAGLPKIKISKPSAGKKSITVKWKKLDKKQLKKGVTKIEVWVCPNAAFGAGDTYIKFAGKKKAAVKVKGLRKGTYFVKVRAIKEAGGVKYYTAWSKIKKVKVKK